jgi:hypothetical protein
LRIPQRFHRVSILPRVAVCKSAILLFLLLGAVVQGQGPRPSLRPVLAPRQAPQRQPTGAPTDSLAPSDLPSTVPSEVPSSGPTFSTPFSEKQLYQQQFLVPDRGFNDTETALIGDLFSSFTLVYRPDSVRVKTTCKIDSSSQKLKNCSLNTDIDCVNELEYFCSWESPVTNVTDYPSGFTDFMNANLVNVTLDMRDLTVGVIAAFPVSPFTRVSPSPTTSLFPSHVPTSSPSTTPPPTAEPSDGPTSIAMRTSRPTVKVTFPPPPPTAQPTTAPPTDRGNVHHDHLRVGLVVSLVVIAGLAVLAGLIYYYQQRRKRIAEQLPMAAGATAGRRRQRVNPNMEPGDDSDMIVVPASLGDSLVSNSSMLSKPGSFDDDSDVEPDGTKNLQDEFDAFKDQNLEQLRSDVEGNLSGFEGIMSAAVTKALMSGNDEAAVDKAELLWGCRGEPSGPEVEASALCEVNDWLKRTESASVDASVERKRAFMQEMLNKMVASVREGFIDADDASRTIHESAALLGLELENVLPMTTVIVSGMRKTVTAPHIVKALKEFGDIDTAAVASGQRGLGIVRFRHPKSVDRAMQKYRNNEIVVQDVAVEMKVLRPNGTIEVRGGILTLGTPSPFEL